MSFYLATNGKDVFHYGELVPGQFITSGHDVTYLEKKDDLITKLTELQQSYKTAEKLIAEKSAETKRLQELKPLEEVKGEEPIKGEDPEKEEETKTEQGIKNIQDEKQ